MRKFLTIMSAFGLVATAAAPVVSCSKKAQQSTEVIFNNVSDINMNFEGEDQAVTDITDLKQVLGTIAEAFDNPLDVVNAKNVTIESQQKSVNPDDGIIYYNVVLNQKINDKTYTSKSFVMGAVNMTVAHPLTILNEKAYKTFVGSAFYPAAGTGAIINIYRGKQVDLGFIDTVNKIIDLHSKGKTSEDILSSLNVNDESKNYVDIMLNFVAQRMKYKLNKLTENIYIAGFSGEGVRYKSLYDQLKYQSNYLTYKPEFFEDLIKITIECLNQGKATEGMQIIVDNNDKFKPLFAGFNFDGGTANMFELRDNKDRA